ncbi:ORF109 [White spot syndrome virus]|uniref:ORF109 n=1 Tax=White spot syndrome virus TaxID=342409 RepID=A0A2D3I6Q7_9VIRU|nr:ORF109 [White spot syndrome virus]
MWNSSHNNAVTKLSMGITLLESRSVPPVINFSTNSRFVRKSEYVINKMVGVSVKKSPIDLEERLL